MATKQKKFRVYVQYFIQNDSWESLGEPNLFVLPDEYTNLNDVKVEDVYSNFPLKNRFSLYLRFYLDDKTQNLNEWIDLPPSATLPIYNNGSVYVKVLRLPKGTDIKFKNNEVFQKKKPRPATNDPTQKQSNPNKDLYSMEDENKRNQQPMQMKDPNEAKPQPKPQNLSKPSYLIPQNLDFSEISKDLQEGNGMSSTSSSMPSTAMPVQEPKQTNPLKPPISQPQTSKTPIPENKGQQAFNEWDNIFNTIDFNKKQEPLSPKNKHQSILENIFTYDVNPQMNPQPQPQSQPPSMPIHDMTGKNLMPIEKIPSNLSEDEMKERIDEIVRNWSMGINERKNVLFLLSTLHEVWTNDPLWTRVLTEDLVNDQKKLKSKYRTALGVLHPDKNQTKDFKTQYLASSLYQIFSEAKDLYK